MELAPVKQVSECFIKPKYEVQESKHPYHLSPSDVITLSINYNQKGLVFRKPNQEAFDIEKLLESLKDSLSLTLVHFYPLAGQFETIIDEDKHRCIIFVDCNKGPGARFVHATLDMSVADIVSATHIPTSVVREFFDHNKGEVNYDGNTMPLLSIQVTELFDGIFIGMSMNHTVVDGTSFWHFWNMWSTIQRANCQLIGISRLPVHSRWFPDGYGPEDVFFPYTNPNQIMKRYVSPQLKERVFHFSSETIAKLKASAIAELSISNVNIKVSSLQSLMAFVWRSVTIAKGLNPSNLTCCRMVANNRTRLDPPLPEEYLGNLVSFLESTTTTYELLNKNLGQTAFLLHQVVANHSNKVVVDSIYKWFDSPFVVNIEESLRKDIDCIVHFGSSPRFNVYGNEFIGLGKPIAVRSGYANKFDGKVTVFPGYEGGGSVDLEICLSSDCMRALESNKDFMAHVSSPT